jgi:hypothetical protein
MAFVDAGYGPPDSPKGWDANDGMRHLSLLMHGDPEVHWTTEQVYRAMCYHTELSRDEDGIHCIDPRCQTFWPWGEVYAELRTKVR